MKGTQQYAYDIISVENDNQKILDILEEYKNKCVIEALEDICNDEETEYIRHRIKELKIS